MFRRARKVKLFAVEDVVATGKHSMSGNRHSRHRRDTEPNPRSDCSLHRWTYSDIAHAQNILAGSWFFRKRHLRTTPCTCIYPSSGCTRRGWSTPLLHGRRQQPLPRRSTPAQSDTCARNNRPHPIRSSNRTFDELCMFGPFNRGS